MRPTATATTLLVTLLAAPALGQEALESVFQVTYRYAGTDEILNDTTVPLLPDNACYSWYIRLGADAAPKTAVEILRLPVPLADWGSLATDPDDGVDISADSKVATRTFAPEPDDEGWFSHTWCAAAGDPTGAHSITVAADGKELAKFDFTVVLPEDYYWPTIIQPQPHERSVDRSW